MSSRKTQMDKCKLFVRMDIDKPYRLKSSLSLLPMKIDGRPVPIILSPLMVSNAVYLAGTRYLNDRTAMLYAHMMNDPSVVIKYIPKVNSMIDVITYYKGDNILKVTTPYGLSISVNVGRKVSRYADSIVEMPANVKAYLISSMYIYSKPIMEYKYPLAILTNSSVVGVDDTGRILIGKEGNPLISKKVEFSKEKESYIEILRGLGKDLIYMSKKMKIDYNKLCLIMSMIQYTIGAEKGEETVYGSKYVDFIIREIVKEKIETIALKRLILKYLQSYKKIVFLEKEKI